MVHWPQTGIMTDSGNQPHGHFRFVEWLSLLLFAGLELIRVGPGNLENADLFWFAGINHCIWKIARLPLDDSGTLFGHSDEKKPEWSPSSAFSKAQASCLPEAKKEKSVCICEAVAAFECSVKHYRIFSTAKVVHGSGRRLGHMITQILRHLETWRSWPGEY